MKPVFPLLLLFVVACDPKTTVDETVFVCETDADCDDGFSCDPVELICVRERADGAVDAAIDDARTDDAEVDAAIDAELPGPDADADAAEACDPVQPPELPPADLEALSLRSVIPLGRPPGVEELRVLDLDQDPAKALDFLVLRGGRLELHGSAGVRWRTAVHGLLRISGALDLDGDGAFEVVARSATRVFVFSAVNGALRWTLPDSPFGEGQPPIAGVQTVLLEDVDRDGRTELYVADVGCGAGGTGWGAIFRFRPGAEVERVAVIGGPRNNGRCARWHSFSDLDGDGLPELLLSDADGLQGFDPLSGTRRHCGEVAEVVGRGVLPHIADGLGGVFAFSAASVMRLQLDDAPSEQCPNGGLRAEWRVDLSAEPSVEGSAALDVDGDARPELLTSHPDGEGWRTVALGLGGELVFELPGRLVAATRLAGGPLLLLSDGSSGFASLRLYGVEDGAPVEGAEIEEGVVVMERLIASTHRTQELRAPVVAADHLVLRLGVQGVSTRLALVDGAGVQATLELMGEPGAVQAVAEGLAVGLSSAEVAALDGALEQSVPGPRIPTGRASLSRTTLEGAPLLVAAVNGSLGAVDLTASEDPLRWTTGLGPEGGTGLRSVPLEEETILAVRDGRVGGTAWSGLDARDGATLWTHRLSEDYIQAGGLILAEGLLHRFEFVLDEDFEAEDCPQVPPPEGDAGEVCDRPIYFRVVTALDPETGACVRQTVFPPWTTCRGASNQRLSLANGRLFMTESDAVRELDPATGAVIGTTIPEPTEEGGGQSGGAMMGAGERLLRVGGNGPIEARDAELELVWRAEHPEGLRRQSWIGRPAWVVGDEVWASPSQGWPLNRYALADGALRGTVGLDRGALVDEGPVPDVSALTVVPALQGEGSRVVISTDDGWMTVLSEQAELLWSRDLGAVPGPIDVANFDADPDAEMVVPIADGTVLLYDTPAPGRPDAVWDLPCPLSPTCDPTSDVDQTRSTTELCAEWRPVAGAERYEYRVLGPNSAVIRDWAPTEEAYVHVDGLDLFPGLRYRVEVRTYDLETDGRSAANTSDGVDVINEAPPEVSIAVDAVAIPSGGDPAVFTIGATDDDLLAAWRLEVLDQGGEVVHLIRAEAVAARSFEGTVNWNGTDARGEPLVGQWRVRLTAKDRAGLEASAAVDLRICDGPC